MEIAEMRATAQQFPQHERGPALSEDFGALGDRAKLTVASHRHLRFASNDVRTIAARGLLTSPNSGRGKRSHSPALRFGREFAGPARIAPGAPGHFKPPAFSRGYPPRARAVGT